MRSALHERRVERRSIFLTFLIPKLPAPAEEDMAKGILDTIDMDSYRLEKRAVQQIMLADEDAEIEPVPTSGGSQLPEPEMERLSNILKTFNKLFGNIEWDDGDRVLELITNTIPAKVAADPPRWTRNCGRKHASGQELTGILPRPSRRGVPVGQYWPTLRWSTWRSPSTGW